MSIGNPSTPSNCPAHTKSHAARDLRLPPETVAGASGGLSARLPPTARGWQKPSGGSSSSSEAGGGGKTQLSEFTIASALGMFGPLSAALKVRLLMMDRSRSSYAAAP